MRQVVIPRTDMRASAIAFGTVYIGSHISLDESFRLLDMFLDAGGILIDTASVYANWLGDQNSSEKAIGRWLAARRARGRVLLSTKGGHPELSTMHISRLSPAEVRSDLDKSLRNLGVDTIDIYWLHRDDEGRPVGEMLETLEAAAKAGQIRYYGCSNWRLARIREARAYADEHGLTGFVANQPMWSLAVANPEAIRDKTMVAMDEAMWAYHAETGMAVIPYTSQAGGLFQKATAAGGWENTAISAHYRLPENEERLERAQRVAAESGLTLTQVVLGYLLSQPFVTIPLVGCRTPEQLEDSLSAGDVQLTPEQVEYLEGKAA